MKGRGFSDELMFRIKARMVPAALHSRFCGWSGVCAGHRWGGCGGSDSVWGGNAGGILGGGGLGRSCGCFHQGRAGRPFPGGWGLALFRLCGCSWAVSKVESWARARLAFRGLSCW